MGGVRDVKRRMGKQRPIRVTVLVVIAATVMLMSAPVGQTLGLLNNICTMSGKSVEIKPYDRVYLGSNSKMVRVRLESAGCVNASTFLYTPFLKDRDRITLSLLSSSARNWEWHVFTFISCGKYITKIGSKIVEFESVQPREKYVDENGSRITEFGDVPPNCLSKSTTLTVGANTVLGKKCTGRESKVKPSNTECKKLEQDSSTFLDKLLRTYVPSDAISVDLSDSAEPDRNTSHTRPLFRPDFFGDEHNSKEPKVDNSEAILKEPKMDSSEGIFKEPKVEDNRETLLNWPKDKNLLLPDTVTLPTYNPDDFFLNDNPSYNPGYTVRRKYKENAIPIFIGIVALTVSMCLRFCLCRGKSVMRRVTTVTVIRSRPVGSPEAPQDQQDPPPSYVDVVNEPTLPERPPDEGSAEPPPPAYADIVDENQPPTYSEVEAQSLPASEMLPLAEQEAGTQNMQPPPDSELTSDAKGLASTKSMLSKYRNQQKQFAFKTLEED